MNFCEIDKYASKSYCAIHGVSEQINLRDVSTVNTAELHDVNLITYGFPCQDISQAGHQKGFFDKNGNVTRSGLFFAALKIIKDTKPEYAIYIKDSKGPVIKNHITLPKAQWSDLDTKNPFKLNTAATISYKREDKKNDE